VHYVSDTFALLPIHAGIPLIRLCRALMESCFFFKVAAKLKGLSHEMDLAFEDMHSQF
jgi:hypothetical protein